MSDDDAPVLVTGGSGYLGEWIIRTLVARGRRVRALARSDKAAGYCRDSGAHEIATGDLSSGEGLREALAGASGLIHAGALTTPVKEGAATLIRTNVEGTRAVFEAARAAGVKRAVHVSSVVAVGMTERPVLQDERSPWDLERFGDPYMTSKRRAEEAVLAYGAQSGMEIVAVNPSIILGPGRRPSRGSARLVLMLVRGEMPALPPGGGSFVDVRDVADATVTALERGRAGERYLLNQHNLPYRAFAEVVRRLYGARRPIPMPRAVARGASLLAKAVLAVGPRALERTPLGDVRGFARAATYFAYFDSRKAREELGLVLRPLEETIVDTVESFIATNDVDRSALGGSEARARKYLQRA